ncbi:hypothetical protein BAE44_0010422 [Dichanthelium oligosanthes]|uniref:Uncharacterized protein n=1 Tax=Dichanthelium oligosanthes TaxID=888268 RepID=A0A1E5VTY5_9POAL|nr:hypothetical protein BAE44_0010422 [Dichanthelium oligosanthes]
MEGGGAARVSPVKSGARRHKALAPWRFQSAFVRRETNPGAVFDGNLCGSATLQVSCETAAGGGLSDELSHGGGVDRELESPGCNGDDEVPKGEGGGGVGGDCDLDGVDGDLVAKEGDLVAKEGNPLSKEGKIHEGPENNGITAEPHGTKSSNLPGFKCNADAEESNSVVKDCNLEGSRTEGTLPGLRKGHKALAPWRFQAGYKPKWLQDLFSGNRSGENEEPASKVGDGSSKRAPGMARNFPCLKGRATKGQRLVKVQKGTGSAPKKRKIDKDDHRSSLVRENVLTKLREFRIIYKTLLEEEEVKWRGGGHVVRPDIAAFNIFRERYGADHDDMRYDGSIPGVRIGDVFNSTMELSIVGELLEDEEAQKRKNDEYLFAIGNNYYGVPRWKDHVKTIPSLQNGPGKDGEIGFAVDALNQGNFASEDIPPLKELSYDYNYEIDKVYDSDGNDGQLQLLPPPSFCADLPPRK